METVPQLNTIALFLALVGIIIFMLLIWRLLTFKKRVKNIINEENSFLNEKFLHRKEVEKTVNKIIDSRLESLESSNRELRNELLNKISKEIPQAVNEIIMRDGQSPTTEDSQKCEHDVLFAKNNWNGLLRITEEAEAQYKLVRKNDSSAEFFFCGDTAKALANFDGTFDKVSEYDGVIEGAKEIKTIERGFAILKPDGKWEVTRKTKIYLT